MEVSFALAGRVWRLEEVTGGGRTRWRGAAWCWRWRKRRLEGSQQGLTMLYRELRLRASGDGARVVRLTGFLAEVSRQAVWYGSRQSVGWAAGVLEVGGGQGWRSVGLS